MSYTRHLKSMINKVINYLLDDIPITDEKVDEIVKFFNMNLRDLPAYDNSGIRSPFDHSSITSYVQLINIVKLIYRKLHKARWEEVGIPSYHKTDGAIAMDIIRKYPKFRESILPDFEAYTHQRSARLQSASEESSKQSRDNSSSTDLDESPQKKGTSGGKTKSKKSKKRKSRKLNKKYYKLFYL